MRPVLYVLLASLVAGGCLGPALAPRGGAVEPLQPEWPELVLDHDHKDPALHQNALGLTLTGFADAQTILETEKSRFSDIQFHGAVAVVTVNGRPGSTAGGFVVLDLSTLPVPSVLGRYRSGSEDNWYTKISPDGRFAFLTANGNPNPMAAPGGLSQGSSPLRGVHIVDISNPRQPALAGFLPAPGRVVNLAVWSTSDRTTLVAASMVNDRTGASAGPVEPSMLNYVGVYEFVPPTDLAAGQRQPAELNEIARWRPANTAGTPNAFPHDLAVGVYPFNGRPLLFVAYWDAGGYVLDVSDPTRPSQVAHVPPMSATDHVHTFKPHDRLIGGKYYAVIAPETFGAEPAGYYRLLDLTDARKPQVVGSWTPPGELVNPEPLLFSPHEFYVANERLYASQFHGGVWVLSIPSFEPIAMWQTSYGSPERNGEWAVNVSQCAWYAGHLYAVDMATGIVVLKEDLTPFS